VLNLRERWRLSILARVLRVLTKRDRKKIIAIAIIQICMSFLDLLGVLMIGLLGALAVNGIGTGNQSGTVATILKFLNVSDLSFQTQALFSSLEESCFFSAEGELLFQQIWLLDCSHSHSYLSKAKPPKKCFMP